MNTEPIITPEPQSVVETAARHVDNGAVRFTKPDSVARVVEALKVTAESSSSAEEFADAVEALPDSIGTSSDHLEREIIRRKVTNSGSVGMLLRQKFLADMTPDQKRNAILLISKRQSMQRIARLSILTSIANSNNYRPSWLQDERRDNHQQHHGR